MKRVLIAVIAVMMVFGASAQKVFVAKPVTPRVVYYYHPYFLHP